MKGKSMFRILCSSLLVISTSLFGAERKFATQFEVQQDLFAMTIGPSMVNVQIEQRGATKKSPAMAAIYSLIVPGLGEHYAEGWGATGKYFSALDIYGSSLQDDARSFAAAHAAVNPAGKDDDYFVDIGNFVNTQEFNDKRLRDREPERLYNVNAGYAWQWDSDANRTLYKEKRISSENVLNNRKFIVTAVIVNHVASAINAARLAISYNKNVNDQIGGLELKADLMGSAWNPHGVMLTLQKNF
jgi:hypothetical protein